MHTIWTKKFRFRDRFVSRYHFLLLGATTYNPIYYKKEPDEGFIMSPLNSLWISFKKGERKCYKIN